MAHDAHIVDFGSADRLEEHLRAAGFDVDPRPPVSPRSLLRLSGLGQSTVEVVRRATAETGHLACVDTDPTGSKRLRALIPGERPGFANLAVAMQAEEPALGREVSVLLEADARRAWSWRVRGRTLHVGPRTLVMAVLNVTSDSFSDGGRYLEPDAAIRHGLRMAEEGADLIDVGGESTRPGAGRVPADLERERLMPVIRFLARETDIPVSVDTTRSEVAAAALDAGSRIVNDVSALALDSSMANVVAAAGAGLILMHMRGTPRDMQADPTYEDLLVEVLRRLRAAMDLATEAGVATEQIAVDPGFGFGKRLEHNLSLVEHLGTLRALGRPIVAGVSRKSFLGAVTGRPVEGRLAASLGAAAAAVCGGAAVVRVHDVAETVEVVRTLDAVRRGREI